MEYRMEHDSMGEVRVPADKYWGAQTERSHENFPIGVGLETMPREITRAFGVLKLAAARANHALKPEKMTDEKLAAIEQAATEVMEGKLFAHFGVFRKIGSISLLRKLTPSAFNILFGNAETCSILHELMKSEPG